MVPPHLKLLDKKVTAMHFHTVNENPFETVNLSENIRKYQCIEKTYRNQRQMNPPHTHTTATIFQIFSSTR